tara:strand:- start:48249 stop:48695 length:447 start_codon:yes stop_codon:yes gene_type:complete
VVDVASHVTADKHARVEPANVQVLNYSVAHLVRKSVSIHKQAANIVGTVRLLAGQERFARAVHVSSVAFHPSKLVDKVVPIQAKIQTTVVVVGLYVASQQTHVVVQVAPISEQMITTVALVEMLVQALKHVAMVSVVPTTKRTVVGLV